MICRCPQLTLQLPPSFGPHPQSVLSFVLTELSVEPRGLAGSSFPVQRACWGSQSRFEFLLFLPKGMEPCFLISPALEAPVSSKDLPGRWRRRGARPILPSGTPWIAVWSAKYSHQKLVKEAKAGLILRVLAARFLEFMIATF